MDDALPALVRFALGFAFIAAFFGPGTALLLALDARKRKPAVARRCARAGLYGALISPLVCCGFFLATSDSEGLAMGLGIFMPVLGLIEGTAGVLCRLFLRSQDRTKAL